MGVLTVHPEMLVGVAAGAGGVLVGAVEVVRRGPVAGGQVDLGQGEPFAVDSTKITDQRGLRATPLGSALDRVRAGSRP